MNNTIMDKLSIRTTDYFLGVGKLNEEIVKNINDTVKGVVLSQTENVNLKNVRTLHSSKQLDESAFDKVWASFEQKGSLNFSNLIYATDHMGMVLLTGIPKAQTNTKKQMLQFLSRKGIYETWFMDGDKPGTTDLLFRVRKYFRAK